jgi:hypothetical protein
MKCSWRTIKTGSKTLINTPKSEDRHFARDLNRQELPVKLQMTALGFLLAAITLGLLNYASRSESQEGSRLTNDVFQ